MFHAAPSCPACVLTLAMIAPVASAQLDPMLTQLRLPLVPAAFVPTGGCATADVDLDGLDDLLLLCFDTDTHEMVVAVLRGLPAGGYAAAVNWPLELSGTLRVADLEDNGWPDLAVQSDHHVSVLYGVGNGDFLPPAAYYVSDGSLCGLQLADIDRDGRLDLVTACTTADGSPWVCVNFADGSGGYLATQSWPAGQPPRDLACGDLDGDGWIDAVTVSQQAGTLHVLRGDGSGGFLPPTSQACDVAPVKLLLGPLDGDGDLDAVVVAEGPTFKWQGTTRAFLNDGTGALSPAGLVTAGKLNDGGLLQDADADGDLDVVVTDGSGATLFVMANLGSGQLALSHRLSLGVGVRAALAADATGDGGQDLLVLSDEPDAVLIPALPDGALACPPTCDLVPSPRRIALGDLDDDGWLDALLCGWSPETVGTLLGSPDGLQLPLLDQPQLVAWENDAVALADLTGDGRQDALVAHSQPVTEVVVGPGLGDGHFGAPLAAGFADLGQSATALAALDLDVDGWRDVLLFIAGPAARLQVFLNQGAAQPGQPGPPASYPPGPTAAHLALGDLDLNGSPDAVVTRAPTGIDLPWKLAVLSGDSQGGFGPDEGNDLPATSSNIHALVLADFDLDGLLDAALGCEGGELIMARGDGGGGLHPEPPIGSPTGGSLLAALDLDGDGWPDLVQAGSGAGQPFAVHRGDGAGGLQPPVLHAGAGSYVDVAVADMNRDDLPDLVMLSADIISPHRGHVRTLQNTRRSFAWTDLHHAKAGALGEPRAAGTGVLEPGTPGALRLAAAAAFEPVMLFTSATEALWPWKGGVLVPLPEYALALPATDANGCLVVSWSAWPSLGAGTSVALQFATADAAAQGGVSLSNALRATEAD